MTGFSKVKCIRGDVTLGEAQKLMSEFRIRHFPVIDDQNQIIGMISLHDFLGTESIKDFPVSFFVSSPVQYVFENDEIKKVSLMMVEKKISSVLVLNEAKELVGLITATDLLYYLSQLLDNKFESPRVQEVYNSKSPIQGGASSSVVETIGQLAQKLSDIGI